MARRNTKDQATAEATNAEGTEPTNTSDNTENTEPKGEEAVNLTAFQEAANAVVAKRDSSTGEVAVADIEPANTAYRDLDGIKAKNAAKSWLDEQMKESLVKLDAQLARAYSMIKDNLSAGAKATTHREPVDPTQAYVNRLAAFSLAYGLITNNPPEGVEVEKAQAQAQELAGSLGDQVKSYQEWLETEVPEGEDKPDAPEVSAVVRTAFKLSTGKASGGGRVSGGSGVRRDIGKHIASAFANVESGGFLTIAEISNFKSEEYGEDSPSQGAVSARLFPTSGKCTIEGIVPLSKSDSPKGVRGAKKA